VRISYFVEENNDLTCSQSKLCITFCSYFQLFFIIFSKVAHLLLKVDELTKIIKIKEKTKEEKESHMATNINV